VSEYTIGQTVLLKSVNSRGKAPSEVVITRVGRKLVYIEEYGRELAFRIADGRRNNQYGHEWIETPERAAAKAHRSDVVARLKAHGIDYVGYSGFKQDTETLEHILAVLGDDE